MAARTPASAAAGAAAPRGAEFAGKRLDEDFGSSDEVRVYKDEGGDEEEQRRSEENLQEDKLGLVKEGEEKGDERVSDAQHGHGPNTDAPDWSKQPAAGASDADPFSSFFGQFNRFCSNNPLFPKLPPPPQNAGSAANAQAALAAAFAAACSNPVAAFMMYNQAVASTAKQVSLPSLPPLDGQKSGFTSLADSARAPLTAASSNSLPSTLSSPTPPPSLSLGQLRSSATSSSSNNVASVPRSPQSCQTGCASKELNNWPTPPNPSYVALAAAAMQLNLNAMFNQDAEAKELNLKQHASFPPHLAQFAGAMRHSEGDLKEMKTPQFAFPTNAAMFSAESHCTQGGNANFGGMSSFPMGGNSDQSTAGAYRPSSPPNASGHHPFLLDLSSRFGGSPSDFLKRTNNMTHNGHQSLGQPFPTPNAFRNFETMGMRNRQSMLLSPSCGYQPFVPSRYDPGAPIPLHAFGSFPGAQFGHMPSGFERFHSRMSVMPKREHIKKPLNAFMLFMQEKRAEVVKESSLKESAAINQILGKMWHGLSKEEQQKYYEKAQKEKERHAREHPGWSARDNYAIHSSRRRKRKFIRTPDGSIVKEESLHKDPLLSSDAIHTHSVASSANALAGPSGEGAHRKLADPNSAKKCRARYGVENQSQWCKPCRRKKKCIRFSGGADDGTENENDDEHDNDNDDRSDHHEDDSHQHSPGHSVSTEIELDVEQCDDAGSETAKSHSCILDYSMSDSEDSHDDMDCRSLDAHAHTGADKSASRTRPTRSLDGIAHPESNCRTESQQIS